MAYWIKRLAESIAGDGGCGIEGAAEARRFKQIITLSIIIML